GEMVLAGDIGELPPAVPLSLLTGIPRVAAHMASPALVTGSAIPAAGPVTDKPRVMVTLRQAVERGHVGPHTTRNSLKMAIWRDHQRPEGERMAPWPVSRDGKEDLYLAEELTAFDASRPRTPCCRPSARRPAPARSRAASGRGRDSPAPRPS